MSRSEDTSLEAQLALSVEALRWRCPEQWLPFETTDEIEPRTGVEGQVESMEALRFGLESKGVGHNVFLCGINGGGRLELIRELIERKRPGPGPTIEYAYVCNLAAPERPRLLELPAGGGLLFRRLVRRFAGYIKEELANALQSDAIRLRHEALERQEADEMDRLTKPFSEALAKAGLELVSVKKEGAAAAMPAIFPLVDGKPTTPEELEALHERGELSKERLEEYQQAVERFQADLAQVTARAGQLLRRSTERKKEVLESPARALLEQAAEPVYEHFPQEGVRRFLSEVIDDVVENRLEGSSLRAFDPHTVYGVNLLEPRRLAGPRPVVVENHPSVTNLVGNLDSGARAPDRDQPDHHLVIRAGSLLRADGGYLIADARHLVAESGSWKVLVRTLSSGVLEIAPPELQRAGARGLMKPDPIPIKLRVILVGDLRMFRQLEANEPDFNDLFKVLVVVDSTISRSPDSALRYAGVIARLVKKEALLPFHREAVAALIEVGARLADRPHELSTRYDVIEDLAREAYYLASRRSADCVEREDVEEAVRCIYRRSDSPARRYRYLHSAGTFNVQTRGEIVGQVNGLAVMRSTQVPYGIPARLTASVGPGTAGIVDIENEAALGGKIHTKGFHISGGLLRRLLRADHPLIFSASLAFEQSYGKIDGDSASTAEACCLLSALAEAPIDQGLAVTGAIDQRGFIQAVGGCNEKVEGFFDVCREAGLNGRQGVIVPRANVGDLMLRQDLVAACERGEFRVFAIERIEEALELLTGLPAGMRGPDGFEPEGSLLGRAARRVRELWQQSTSRVLQAEPEVPPAELTPNRMSAESREDDGDRDLSDRDPVARALWRRRSDVL